MAEPSQPKATRRDFLKIAAGAAGAAAGPWVSRNAQAKPVSIAFARESSYVKNFDVHFQNVMAPAYEKATGIKIEYQIQAAGGSAVPQLVSMVENKNGADLAWVQQEWLYRDALVDVSDIAEEVGKQQGGWYDEIKRLSVDKGKWKSVPNGNIGQLMNYRKDWFDEAGVRSFPETWDEFLEAGIKLKAKGHPFGMSMGHGFADNYSWLYPLLWSYGVTVMDKDGKKVALDDLTPDLDPRFTDQLRIVTLTVSAEPADGSAPPQVWPGLPPDPRHRRAGKPDSLFDLFEKDPASPAKARSVPLFIDRGLALESGVDVLEALCRAAPDPDAFRRAIDSPDSWFSWLQNIRSPRLGSASDGTYVLQVALQGVA